MNTHAQVLNDILDELSRRNEPVDMFRLMGLCTLDIICGKGQTNMAAGISSKI